MYRIPASIISSVAGVSLHDYLFLACRVITDEMRTEQRELRQSYMLLHAGVNKSNDWPVITLGEWIEKEVDGAPRAAYVVPMSAKQLAARYTVRVVFNTKPETYTAYLDATGRKTKRQETRNGKDAAVSAVLMYLVESIRPFIRVVYEGEV